MIEIIYKDGLETNKTKVCDPVSGMLLFRYQNFLSDVFGFEVGKN